MVIQNARLWSMNFRLQGYQFVLAPINIIFKHEVLEKKMAIENSYVVFTIEIFHSAFVTLVFHILLPNLQIKLNKIDYLAM